MRASARSDVPPMCLAWMAAPAQQPTACQDRTVQMGGGGGGCRHLMAGADAGRLVATWPGRERCFTQTASGFPCKVLRKT
jgi:hypothetical protein